MEALGAAAKSVLDKMTENDDNGNQYIVVLNLPKEIQSRLDDDKNSLDGIPFRLMFEGSTGLIKVIPSATSSGHQLPHIDPTIASQKGKQPDDCFIPRSRQGVGGQPQDWPTLVIETGVSESIPKLHEDAKWWFQNSNGLVRTVLVLGVCRTSRTIRIQNWQLVPPDQPATPALIQSLQLTSPPPMPPLVQQQPAAQTPYMVQEAIVSPDGALGSVPIVLHFHALFDRPPQGAEADILLDGPTLVSMVEHL